MDDLTHKYKEKEHDLIEEVMKLKENLLEAEKNNETFQSIHEDLQKLNSDYRFTISELTKSKSYLEHQIESLGIPFLFLDEEINIHKFSTGIFQLVNIRQADIGRPIKHYTSVFKDFSIHNLAEDVLASGSPMEDSVLTKNEERYLVKGLPYQTTDNEHQGVVVIFYFIAQSVLEDILPTLAEPLPAPIPEASLPVVEEVAEAPIKEAPVETPEPTAEPNALFAQPTPPLPEVEAIVDPVLPEVEEETVEEEADALPEAPVAESISEVEEETPDFPVIPSLEAEITESPAFTEEAIAEPDLEEALTEVEESTEEAQVEEIVEAVEEEVVEQVEAVEEKKSELADAPVFFRESEPQQPQVENTFSEPEEKEEVIPESIIDETPEKIFPTEETEVETNLDQELPEGVVLPEVSTEEAEETQETSFVAPEFENSFLAIANADEAPKEEVEEVPEQVDFPEFEEESVVEPIDSILSPEE